VVPKVQDGLMEVPIFALLKEMPHSLSDIGMSLALENLTKISQVRVTLPFIEDVQLVNLKSPNRRCYGTGNL